MNDGIARQYRGTEEIAMHSRASICVPNTQLQNQKAEQGSHSFKYQYDNLSGGESQPLDLRYDETFGPLALQDFHIMLLKVFESYGYDSDIGHDCRQWAQCVRNQIFVNGRYG
mmetsp:Transcript_28215/g.67107  ORF Transcript_28215/g.67107 Transcript_28215/m.67107 type:complete len:113 (-) Transcript_28215:639-977(-)